MARNVQTPDKYKITGLSENPLVIALLPMEIDALVRNLHDRADENDGFSFWEMRAYSKFVEAISLLDTPIPAFRAKGPMSGKVTL